MRHQQIKSRADNTADAAASDLTPKLHVFDPERNAMVVEVIHEKDAPANESLFEDVA